MKVVNNFIKIAPLLKWEKEGEYYFVQLILRKKDGATTFGNKNNSARIIKTYQFFNIEQFFSKEEEIIQLCELFGCRAGINLNKRNEEEITYKVIEHTLEFIKTKNFRGINGILSIANGEYKSKTDKFWLIDCDTEEELEIATDILSLSKLRPEGEKIITILPTYTGHHIITTKFDVMVFDSYCKTEIGKTIDIHKNNPTALYYPTKS